MASFDELQSLGAQHISAHLASYEAARSGFFTFTVDNLDNIVRAGAANRDEPSSSDMIARAGEFLTLNVTKAKVPHFSLKAEEYRRGNEVVKFAGVPTFDSGSITVDDVVGLDTKSILMAWQALAYDVNTGKGGRMKDYKKVGHLTEYTQDYKKIRSWKLVGCWISHVSEGDFDKESDSKRQLEATIEYDRAYMELDLEDNQIELYTNANA